MSLLTYIPMLADTHPQLAHGILALEESFLALCSAYVQQKKRQSKKRKARSEWVRPYLKRRKEHGHFHSLMEELKQENPEIYKNFLRFDEELFNEIVERVTPLLEKKTTWYREPIEVGQRVAITLRFLATGDTYVSIGYAFRVAPNTISLIVPETCLAIITAYEHEVLRMPDTPEGWKKVAKGFQDRWNLPHAIGAIDGKHIRLKSPNLSGSLYYNYKKFFSIVLLALVDADYKFLFIDVGSAGSESDAGIFGESKLADIFNKNLLNLPPSEPLPGDPNGQPIPYFIVGDDAFALKTWLMKPYPSRGLDTEQRIFNYRLSRGRRIVENAFGILSSRFRVFHTSMLIAPEKAELVIMAACILHNLMRIRFPTPSEVDQEHPTTHELVPGEWRSDPSTLRGIGTQGSNRSTTIAQRQRQYLTDYFNSPVGSVPWQKRMI